MAKKTWEFRIYINEDAYENILLHYSDTGFNNKKIALFNAKHYVKQNKLDGCVVKIQSDDREVIEPFIAKNRFGEIIFMKR